MSYNGTATYAGLKFGELGLKLGELGVHLGLTGDVLTPGAKESIRRYLDMRLYNSHVGEYPPPPARSTHGDVGEVEKPGDDML